METGYHSQVYLLAIVTLQVEEVGGVEASVHTFTVPRDATLVVYPLQRRLEDKVVQIAEHVSLQLLSKGVTSVT